MGFFSSLFKEIKPDNEHICGGTTDKTDHSAPKFIVSKDIVGLKTRFCLSERITNKYGVFASYRIEQDENGVLTAKEDYTGASAEADKELLEKLQDIIDRYELVLKNGYYRVTAGLPPECQPCSLNVVYASGEKLDFTVNNDCEDEWEEKLHLTFAEWFAKKGDSSLMPPKETSQVVHMRVRTKTSDREYIYGNTQVEASDAVDGQTELLEKDERVRYKTVSRKLITFPEGYYEKITEIFDRYDLSVKYRLSIYDRKQRDLGNHNRGYYGFGEKPDGEEDSQTFFIKLNVEYESGTKINIHTKKPSEIKALSPMVDELHAYLDPFFEKNG